MALGARPGEVMASVVRRGMALTAAGLALGITAALGLGRLIAGTLAGLSPADPISFAAAALFLSAVALAACYFPARRATRIEPMRALRD